MPDFLLPDLGEGLTEAEIVAWHVQVGDTVSIDQPVVEVETAKAVVEVPIPFAGRVIGLHAEVGDIVPVGLPLITVESVDAQADSSVPPPPAASPVFVEPGAVVRDPIPDQGESGSVLIGYGTTSSKGRRRTRLQVDHGIVPAAPANVAKSNEAVSNHRIAVASPLVRRLALLTGVELGALIGSGPQGLITRRDVEQAIASGRSAAEAVAAKPLITQAGLLASDDVVRIPIRGSRKAAADKLSKSRREIPEATVWVDVDVSALIDLRKTMNADSTRPSIGILALVSRFVLLGLRRYPQLNARIERDEITIGCAVNLGFAAQTDRGLVVPVIHGAEKQSVEELSSSFAQLTTQARDGKLGLAELTGGTFTVNNYGVFGVDGSAAIINHPEVAIFGIGRIFPRPWVVAGQVEPRPITELTLAFDHRVCDGGVAGGFLRFVADCIESPAHALRHL